MGLMNEATVRMPFVLAERAPQKALAGSERFFVRSGWAGENVARSEGHPDNPLQLVRVEETR